jgi:hypothetical protein
MSKPQSRKAKGRKLQQHIRDRITQVFGLDEGDVESRSMGAGGVDVMLSPRARKVCPLSVESKNTRGIPSMKAVEQSRYNKYPNTLPVVAWKPHGKQYDSTLVMVSLEDLLAFLKEKLNEQHEDTIS